MQDSTRTVRSCLCTFEINREDTNGAPHSEAPNEFFAVETEVGHKPPQRISSGRHAYQTTTKSYTSSAESTRHCTSPNCTKECCETVVTQQHFHFMLPACHDSNPMSKVCRLLAHRTCVTRLSPSPLAPRVSTQSRRTPISLGSRGRALDRAVPDADNEFCLNL